MPFARVNTVARNVGLRRHSAGVTPMVLRASCSSLRPFSVWPVEHSFAPSRRSDRACCTVGIGPRSEGSFMTIWWSNYLSRFVHCCIESGGAAKAAGASDRAVAAVAIRIRSFMSDSIVKGVARPPNIAEAHRKTATSSLTVCTPIQCAFAIVEPDKADGDNSSIASACCEGRPCYDL
jgi:hypothetical protein